jgi:hypothetical protein
MVVLYMTLYISFIGRRFARLRVWVLHAPFA